MTEIEFPPLPQAIRVIDLPQPSVPNDLPPAEKRVHRTLQLEGPEGAAWFIRHLKETVEKFFRRQGEIFPMVLLLIDRHPETSKLLDDPNILPMGIDPTMMNTDEGKNGFVNYMKGMAARTDAFGWAMMVEAWKLETKGESIKERLAGYGQVADHPDRKEIINVTYQHRALGDESRGLMTPIKRGFKSNGQPRAQLGQWVEFNGVTGRFANVLIPQKAKVEWEERMQVFKDFGWSKAKMIAKIQEISDRFHPDDPARLVTPILIAKIQEMDIK